MRLCGVLWRTTAVCGRHLDNIAVVRRAAWFWVMASTCILLSWYLQIPSGNDSLRVPAVCLSLPEKIDDSILCPQSRTCMGFLNRRNVRNDYYDYDAFVVFSSQDQLWVAKTMRAALEDKRGFKLLLDDNQGVFARGPNEGLVTEVVGSFHTLIVLLSAQLRDWTSGWMSTIWKLYARFENVARGHTATTAWHWRPTAGGRHAESQELPDLDRWRSHGTGTPVGRSWHTHWARKTACKPRDPAGFVGLVHTYNSQTNKRVEEEHGTKWRPFRRCDCPGASPRDPMPPCQGPLLSS